MRIKLFIALLVAHFSSAASADVSCRAAASLGRMQANIPIFEAAAISENPVATLGSLYADMQQMDKPTVARLFRGSVSRSDLAVLTDFVTLTHRIYDLTNTGQSRGIRAIVFSNEFAPAFSQAGAILRELNCPSLDREASSISLSIPTKGISSLSSASEGIAITSKMTLRQKGIALLSVCFFGSALTFGIWLRNERLALMRRRNHRFQLCRTIRYVNGQDTQIARVIDISGYGAKIEHNGLLTTTDEDNNTKLDLQLGEETEPCKVMWVNSHYAGVKFEALKSRRWIKWYLDQPDTLADLFQQQDPILSENETEDTSEPEPPDAPPISIKPVQI